ncbi:TetR/AcrR family transcriptional regulator [Domibacillus sp. PGB-M46]|uniref:TetR/AcrR family transcriptional regulator n=1 Tax=Domibacillus sp. PGB-M46 TaxID=2910255 RepID=UPI001F59682D|nr:TetR/AcrR family transcriptional regulator [Domibacillus sp. PGB-M46]MCI2253895.1 TetR/AcrR family transcriptional regulator [Domibacillus sp. PGB-M46]
MTLEAVEKNGLSKGGWLYHFPGKDALIKGMVEDWSNQYFKEIQELAANANGNDGKWKKTYINLFFSILLRAKNRILH